MSSPSQLFLLKFQHIWLNLAHFVCSCAMSSFRPVRPQDRFRRTGVVLAEFRLRRLQDSHRIAINFALHLPRILTEQFRSTIINCAINIDALHLLGQSSVKIFCSSLHADTSTIISAVVAILGLKFILSVAGQLIMRSFLCPCRVVLICELPIADSKSFAALKGSQHLASRGILHGCVK